jgi:hypothetical protein
MASMNALAQNLVDISQAERRRHQRVKLSLGGRFMRGDRKEFDCTTIDMSPGGVALRAQSSASVGERVVVYLNQIGRVEGVCVRAFEGGFAMTMQMPAIKRERLADQLTWLANRQGLGIAEDREHPRIKPRTIHTILKLASGLERPAKLLDVSRSGAAMTVDVSPPLGESVFVGKTPAQVVRNFANGVAVEFNRVLPEDFSEDTVL